MTYQQALARIREDFETKRLADHCEYIRTGLTLDGYHFFPIYLYNAEQGLKLTDIGKTKEAFDEVEDTEWETFCAEYGFRYQNWRIERDFQSMQDIDDFITFLGAVADRYDPLDDEDIEN